MDCVSGCYAEIRHHSSSVGRNVLHLSFKVKYCHEIFNDEQVEKRCEEIFREVSEMRRWILREIGFDKNHVHIFCGASPKLSPLRIIEIIKSITARKVFEKFPKLKKKELWGGEFWSDGKYIGTVGEATSEKTIRNYIKKQSMDKIDEGNRMKQLKLFKL